MGHYRSEMYTPSEEDELRSLSHSTAEKAWLAVGTGWHEKTPVELIAAEIFRAFLEISKK